MMLQRNCDKKKEDWAYSHNQHETWKKKDWLSSYIIVRVRTVWLFIKAEIQMVINILG